MQSFIFATDLHGIEQDAPAVKSFKSFTDSFDKGALRIVGGDLWNFASLRRAASEDEKKIRLKEDFYAGIDFLEWFKPSVLLLGNHDQRLWDTVTREKMNRVGWQAELAETYVTEFNRIAKRLNILVKPYDKRKGIYRVGKVSFAHGFGHGSTLTENMARTYGTVIFGHGHKIERASTMRDGYPVTAYQMGCLASSDMEYTRADLSSLRQEQGWGYGVLGKQTEIFQARVINGKALVADGFKLV